MKKEETPLGRGPTNIPICKEGSRVYKGSLNNGAARLNKKQRKPVKIANEVQRAQTLIFQRLVNTIRNERDITRNDPGWISEEDGGLNRYINTYTYPQDGWAVHKILLPDRAAKKGEGYHRVSVVTTTAATEDGVSEAIRRSCETKTLLEKTKAHITDDTVIVLSHNIPFGVANRLRSVFSNIDRTVFIYSVKNALGVARNVLKKFANLFIIRAQKIIRLPNLGEQMQELADTLSKRGEKLSKAVSQLTDTLKMMLVPKREQKRARDEAWKFLTNARKLHVKVFIDKEMWDGDLTGIYNIIIRAADRQGIDLDAAQQEEIDREAQRQEERLFGVEPLKGNVDVPSMRSFPKSKSLIPVSNVPYIPSNSGW